MTWKEFEFQAFQWFKGNYDSNATHKGRSNAKNPDIISSIYGVIEVKKPKAQCGQFTKSEINQNEFNKYIASKPREEVTEEEAKAWCRHYYKEVKKVNYFITYNNNQFQLLTCDNYFDTHTCTLQTRITKKSGSSTLPKCDYKYIPPEWHYTLINKKAYVLDKTLWKVKYSYIGENNITYEMMPSYDKKGEIRKLSNTYGITWIFSVQ